MVSKLSTENETVLKRTSKATPIHSTVVAHKPGCEDRLTRHKTAKSTHELLPPAAKSRSGKPQPVACTCHTACPEHGAHACMIMFFCCFLFSSALIVGLLLRRCLGVFLWRSYCVEFWWLRAHVFFSPQVSFVYLFCESCTFPLAPAGQAHISREIILKFECCHWSSVYHVFCIARCLLSASGRTFQPRRKPLAVSNSSNRSSTLPRAGGGAYPSSASPRSGSPGKSTSPTPTRRHPYTRHRRQGSNPLVPPKDVRMHRTWSET